MDQHFVSAHSQVNMLPLSPAYSSAWFSSAFLPFPGSDLPSPLPMVHWGGENMLPRNMLALSSHRIPLQQGSVRLQPPEAAPWAYLSGKRPLTSRLLCKTVPYHSELKMVDASLTSEISPEVWVQQCTHSGTEGATGRSQTDSSLSHPRGKDTTQHFKKLRCPRWGRNYTNASPLFKHYQMISCFLPGSIKLVA